MPYSLRELSAHFTKYEERLSPSGTDCLYVPVETLAQADGIRFICPKCKDSGEWPHPIFIGFEGRAKPGTYGYNKAGQPVLWNLAGGTGLDDLSLTPSIQIEGGCNWHGFVGSSGIPPGWAG